jgi:hypothetical protein
MKRAADDEWGLVRVLGAGGFGSAGLWEKRDKSNKIWDEVVCKEQPYVPKKQGSSSSQWCHDCQRRLAHLETSIGSTKCSAFAPLI